VSFRIKSSASGLGLRLVFRPPAADAFQQVRHPAGRRKFDVRFEVQFGYAKETQAKGELAFQKMASAFERLDSLLLGDGIFVHVQTNLRMLFVRRHQNLSDNRLPDAGIGKLIRNHFTEFLAQGFGNPFGSMLVHFASLCLV
jgi:hypothetical protein